MLLRFLMKLNLLKNQILLPLLLVILGNMCIVIISFQVDDVISFKINLSFLIKPFSFLRAFNLKWRVFPSFLKGFQLQEIYSDPGVIL